MRQHMAVHSGDKKHICHVCAKQFMRKGQLKRHLLPQVKDPVALAMMRAIKATLDPKGILNPGKVL